MAGGVAVNEHLDTQPGIKGGLTGPAGPRGRGDALLHDLFYEVSEMIDGQVAEGIIAEQHGRG